MMSTEALADSQSLLFVFLQDGSRVQFVLPVQKPTVSCSAGVMQVDYQTESDEPLRMSLARDEVAFLKVGTIEELGVESMQAKEQRIQFDLTRAGVVHISGLNDVDRVQVYRLDGKRVKAAVGRSGSEATVELYSQPRGIYMVSVNNSFTFKLMKP